MSLDNYYDIIINTRSRRKDMVRRAEQECLASIARQHHSGRSVYRPILDNVGDSLVRLGLELKERAGSVGEMAPTQIQRKRMAG